MKKKFAFIVFISISILTLAGCGSMVGKLFNKTSSGDIIEKSMKAHEEIDSAKVHYEEEFDGAKSTTILTMDFVNNETNIEINENDEDLFMYLTEDDLFIEMMDGYVEQLDSSMVDAGFKQRIEDLRNPLKALEDETGDISNQLEMEEQDDVFHFSFTGDGEELQGFAEEMIGDGGLGDQDPGDMESGGLDGDVTSYNISFDIDSSTHLFTNIEQKMTLEMNDGSEQEILIHQEYEDYNDIGEIEQLEATANDDIAEEDPVSDDEPEEPEEELDKDTKEKLESEAGEYVDALIQATIFQDQEGFVDAAPSSMDKSDKKSAAETQQEMFKEIYKENTKNNMAGTGVSDEEIDNLTDAFLEALSATDYEVVDADATSSKEVIVTLSIDGLDDMAVYEKTEEDLEKEAMENDMSQDELISKNIEILVDNYEDNPPLKDTVEKEVHVTVESGQYHVLQQDEYLIDGFVQ